MDWTGPTSNNRLGDEIEIVQFNYVREGHECLIHQFGCREANGNNGEYVALKVDLRLNMYGLFLNR